MFAYCNNNPVCAKDASGRDTIYIVETVQTEVVEENEDEVVYRTTISYYIFNADSGPSGEIVGYGSYEGTYTVSKSGIIAFDNKSNSIAEFADANLLFALASEMVDVARNQVEGALNGRTTGGIAFELAAHAFGSFCGIKTENTDITEMGSNVVGSVGYDYNADWFEHPIRNIPKILQKLLD